MNIMKTSSYFVNIVEKSDIKYIKRRIRRGKKPYARTLSFRKIKKILSNSDILYPKFLKIHFNYVYEEYINSTNDVENISKGEINKYFLNTIYKLNKLDVSKYKRYVSWNNNTEFLKFQIDNFNNALKKRKEYEKLDDAKNRLKTINLNIDNNRKLTFIHGDLHLNNLIVNNDNIYLIDWEMATIGDLAYELAIHFLLMNYSKQDELEFINKLLLKIKCDKYKLINDIEEYKKFELIRRNILHNDVKNHYH